MPERTRKTRGNYAKLICLQCRDRRIKCLLPDAANIQPSNQPQPAATSCQRCRHKGLRCIVRKTTLGRPNQKWQDPVSASPGLPGGSPSRSPSPYVDDLVLVNPDHSTIHPVLESRSDSFRRESSSVGGQPTGHLLAEAMDNTLDRTLALLGQDRHFGQALNDLESQRPANILDLVDQKLAEILDSCLVWMRQCLPYIPSLSTLTNDIFENVLDPGAIASATLLLAMLCDIAMDAPVDLPPSARHIQDALRVITHHTGRSVLFELPRHRYTLLSLEIIHKFRPLCLISGRQSATHVLTGRLYSTLEKTMAQQLGLHHAPARLRDLLDGRSHGDARQLVFDCLQWSGCLMSEPLTHGELKPTNPAAQDPENAVEHALRAVSDALDRHLAPDEALLIYHMLRNDADDLYIMRSLTREWDNLDNLKKHILSREDIRQRRQIHLEKCLQELYHAKGQSKEAAIITQLASIQLNVGRANISTLGMFYAIATAAQTPDFKLRNPKLAGPFSRFFLECLHQLTLGHNSSPMSQFLDQFGDPQADVLEKKLASFISAATELSLNGVPFMGPPRRTCCNIVFVCKEIVETNAVRLRVGEGLHPRIDVHLILFMEAARCLEGMEAKGGSPEAMARGSLLTASAKLIRSFHRIILQWKRNNMDKEPAAAARNPATQGILIPNETSVPAQLAPALDLDAVFIDDFFADWENWPKLGAVDASGMIVNDLDIGLS